MNLVQVIHQKLGRRIGLVKEPEIILLDQRITSTYQMFTEIVNADMKAKPVIEALTTNEKILYDLVYFDKSEWKLLPPIDIPENPAMCLISGTGLTHRASAENRNEMHIGLKTNQLSDSMKIYLWGEEGGKPEKGKIGVQPEWFYKGNGCSLKGHGEPLTVPTYADDGGEEPEIAGVYLISEKGIPYRIGFTQGNEFSDHIMEKKNYLYLAPSKLRDCSVGPELALDVDFDLIPGEVSIIRGEKTIWSQSIQSGEQAITHSLNNLEYHHFKYGQHRQPGQLHIHFFGAGAFSFGDNLALEQDDEMLVSFERMGRPLVNSIHFDRSAPIITEIRSVQ